MPGCEGGDIVADVSKAAAALIGIASAAALGAAGCSSSSPHCPTCPTATFDLHPLADSTVTWSVAGATPETITGLVPYPPSAGECSFRYSKGEIINRGIAESWIFGFVNIQCGSVGGGGFDMGIRDPSDLRTWQAGSWQMAAANGGVLADIGSSAGLGCNGMYFNGMELSVTVDTATGSSVPFPKVVTDDFVRTYRLDFDTSTVTPTRPSGEPCGASLSAQVSVHMTQTAADYILSPDAPCGCE
jgi:hypothetical protein